MVEINENPEKHWPGSAGGGRIYGQTRDHGLRIWAFNSSPATEKWAMDYFSFFLSFSFLWTKSWFESWPPQVIIESDDLTV